MKKTIVNDMDMGFKKRFAVIVEFGAFELVQVVDWFDNAFVMAEMAA